MSYVVSDHPWSKNSGTAAVRIAMTVGVRGNIEGQLALIVSEKKLDSDIPEIALQIQHGQIQPMLVVGANLNSASDLKANIGISHQGIILVGEGFRLTGQELARFGYTENNLPVVINSYVIGQELMEHTKNRYVLNFTGMTAEEVSQEYPRLFQVILDRVKPHRDSNRDAAFRNRWWLWGRPRPDMQMQLNKSLRYIATCRTARHRVFSFLPSSTIPDAKVIAISLQDAWYLGVLSSHIHILWANEWAHLGVGNDSNYNHSECFVKFPFPDPPEDVKAKIRNLSERLDKHRKSVMTTHKQLTMTGMYNVLEKVRAKVPPTDAENDVYEAGLVGVLKSIHDDLDAAVAEAYGWPAELSDDHVLERLVALNHERAAEEADGTVRWLRPDFQAPKETTAAKKDRQIEATLLLPEEGAIKPKLPSKLPEQVAAIRTMLEAQDTAITAADLSRCFAQGKRAEKKVEDILTTLCLLGQAEKVGDGFVLGG